MLAPAAGTRISVRISSSARAVVRSPLKKSSALIVRLPFGPSATRSALRAIAAAGQAAADGAHVPHHRVADMTRDLREERTLALEERRALDGVVSGHRADDERAAFFLDSAEAGDLPDVDEV